MSVKRVELLGVKFISREGVCFVVAFETRQASLTPTTLPLTARYFHFPAQLLAVLIFRVLPLKCMPVYCFYAILRWHAYLFA